VTIDHRTDAEKDAAQRFPRDAGCHELRILHEDGLYRHLRFAQPMPHSWAYWFDLITWPGSLTIRGDIGQAYTFSRLPDMFEFFRGRPGRINPHYWAEKLDSGRSSVREYREGVFRTTVAEHVAESIRYGGAPRGIGRTVREDILDLDLYDEAEARKLLDDFEYEGFTFTDTWEWSFTDYSWEFLWACHAVVWGIARYDRLTGYGLGPLAWTAGVSA
jgi:hypothetical protein